MRVIWYSITNSQQMVAWVLVVTAAVPSPASLPHCWLPSWALLAVFWSLGNYFLIHKK